MRRAAIVLVAGLIPLVPALAQSPRGLEVGVAGGLLLADDDFAGGGALVALRPGGRLRIQLAALAGASRGLAGRGELSGQFLLSPGAVRRVGLYGWGGIAGTAGRSDAGYLLLGLGVESAPAASHGWWVEAGAGGGGRLALGWRWRWLARGSRRQP